MEDSSDRSELSGGYARHNRVQEIELEENWIEGIYHASKIHIQKKETSKLLEAL